MTKITAIRTHFDSQVTRALREVDATPSWRLIKLLGLLHRIRKLRREMFAEFANSEIGYDRGGRSKDV